MNAPRRTLLTLGTAGAAMLAAACGSSGSTSHVSAPATGSGPAASSSAVMVGTSRTALGDVLVGADGHTLYALSGDSTSSPACTGSCLQTWPMVTGTPAPGPGVTGALATFTRSDGSSQVTIDGHPLYRYAGDSSSGQTNGEGVHGPEGTWYAVSPSGALVHKASQPAPSPTPTGGYSY